jgi:hypothetical protein
MKPGWTNDYFPGEGSQENSPTPYIIVGAVDLEGRMEVQW